MVDRAVLAARLAAECIHEIASLHLDDLLVFCETLARKVNEAQSRGEGPMAELKTKENAASVATFLARVTDETRRRDCRRLVRLMKKITGEKPRMWGSSIVGFGRYQYRYETGREGEWPLTGFSPRKQDLTVYVMSGFDRQEDLLAKLGPHKLGKSCLYLKGLDGVDENRLAKLIERSVAEMRKKYPPSK